MHTVEEAIISLKATAETSKDNETSIALSILLPYISELETGIAKAARESTWLKRRVNTLEPEDTQ